MFPALLVTVLMIIIAYLFGSISSAIVVCRIWHLPDPRTEGSHNPGATNVLRMGGKLPALITLLGDALKGVVPVLIAKWVELSSMGVALVALAAFIGHLYPLFFRFQGGKGVATCFGCLLALYWPLGLSLIGTWVVIALLFRYSSLAALITALFAPFYTVYWLNVDIAGIISVMSILLLLRHRKNIYKLLKGTEDKIGKKKIIGQTATNEDKLE